MNIEQIKSLLDPYDKISTECDGHTQVCCTLLFNNGVKATVNQGAVSHRSGSRMPFHYWLTLDSGHYIDYRCRMWIQADDISTIPHGVFKAEDYPLIKYERFGICNIDNFWVNDFIMKVNTMETPEQFKKYLK
jgi:hypothetical protein